MKFVKFAILAILLAAILGMTACANVAPWERGNLAKPHMALNPSPLQNSLRSHQYGSREASSGGGAAGGGGCGCY